jgi:hypothetical protein
VLRLSERGRRVGVAYCVMLAVAPPLPGGRGGKQRVTIVRTGVETPIVSMETV